MTDEHTGQKSSLRNGTGTTSPRRGPSIPMLLAALAAFAIAIWAIAEPFSLEFLGSVDLRWALVAGAAVAGVLLVVGPRRKHR